MEILWLNNVYYTGITSSGWISSYTSPECIQREIVVVFWSHSAGVLMGDIPNSIVELMNESFVLNVNTPTIKIRKGKEKEIIELTSVIIY